jgi:hypothetical protein
MDRVLETRTTGTTTYHRHSEWFNNEGAWTNHMAYVTCSDTASGHGWGGHMSKARWDTIFEVNNTNKGVRT